MRHAKDISLALSELSARLPTVTTDKTKPMFWIARRKPIWSGEWPTLRAGDGRTDAQEKHGRERRYRQYISVVYHSDISIAMFLDGQNLIPNAEIFCLEILISGIVSRQTPPSIWDRYRFNCISFRFCRRISSFSPIFLSSISNRKSLILPFL